MYLYNTSPIQTRNHIGSGFITYSMGNSLKSDRWEKRKEWEDSEVTTSVPRQ